MITCVRNFVFFFSPGSTTSGSDTNARIKKIFIMAMRDGVVPKREAEKRKTNDNSARV